MRLENECFTSVAQQNNGADVLTGEKLGSVAMWRHATPKTMKFKACLGNFKAENFFCFGWPNGPRTCSVSFIE